MAGQRRDNAGRARPHARPADRPEARPEARVDVVAAILWQDGRFLAVERPQGRPQAGFWEFPGGKVEPGEGLETALARELDEELGLTPLALEPWRQVSHDYDHLRVRLHFFMVREFQGRPQAREGHAWRWFVPAEALGMPFLPADQALVAELATQADPASGADPASARD